MPSSCFRGHSEMQTHTHKGCILIWFKYKPKAGGQNDKHICTVTQAVSDGELPGGRCKHLPVPWCSRTLHISVPSLPMRPEVSWMLDLLYCKNIIIKCIHIHVRFSFAWVDSSTCIIKLILYQSNFACRKLWNKTCPLTTLLWN